MAGHLQKKSSIRKKIFRKKLLLVVEFLVIFNLLSIPMYIVIFYNLSFESLQIFFTQLTEGFLKFMGYAVERIGYFLTINYSGGSLQIEISWDSTGWKSLYALFALAVATPIKSLKSKAKFLTIGLPLIFVLNFLRIVTTILVGLNYGLNYFDVVHTFLWREGLIFAIVIIWFAWLVRGKESYNITKNKLIFKGI